MGTSQQEDEVLQSYLDHMVDFLVNQNLASSQGSVASNVAHALTFATLRRLDTNYQGILIGFLADNRLINNPSIVNLDGANLVAVELTGFILGDILLVNVNLSQAHLRVRTSPMPS